MNLTQHQITFNGTAEGLRQAIEDFERQGVDLQTLYVKNDRGIMFVGLATLTEQTLTDGSTVYNLVIS